MTNPDAANEAVPEAVAFLREGFADRLGLGTTELQAGLEVARLRMEQGAHHEAMRLYLSLVLCDPRRADFQVGLADCALRMEEHGLALQAASAVIMLAPRDPRGYYLSGRACIGLGQYDEAAEDLDAAIGHARAARDGAIFEAASRLAQRLPAVVQARTLEAAL